MAATDMKLAGLEKGCLAWDENGRLYRIASTSDRKVLADRLADNEPDGRMIDVIERRADYFKRDYEDAQKARHARLDVLDQHYPSDAEPESTDTVERYVGINKYVDWESSAGSGFRWWWHFSDSLGSEGHDFGVLFAMSDVGEMPEAVFDLDTGQRIELNVSVNVIVSEDQGMMVNVLEGEVSA